VQIRDHLAQVLRIGCYLSAAGSRVPQVAP
jgi:hypothetical protein